MALEEARKSNEEWESVSSKDTKKIDDEIDGQVIDDTLGLRRLSAAEIKTLKMESKWVEMKTEQHEGGSETSYSRDTDLR